MCDGWRLALEPGVVGRPGIPALARLGGIC